MLHRWLHPMPSIEATVLTVVGKNEPGALLEPDAHLLSDLRRQMYGLAPAQAQGASPGEASVSGAGVREIDIYVGHLVPWHWPLLLVSEDQLNAIISDDDRPGPKVVFPEPTYPLNQKTHSTANENENNGVENQEKCKSNDYK